MNILSLGKYLQYLKALPCTDCKKNKPGHMSFDHLPQYEKVLDIGAWIHYPKWAVWEELKKCEIVCSRCHKKREKKRNLPSILASRKRRKELKDIGRICSAFYIFREMNPDFHAMVAYYKILEAASAIFKLQQQFFLPPKNAAIIRRRAKSLQKIREIAASRHPELNI